MERTDDFRGGGGLFLHGSSDARGDLANLFNHVGDIIDRIHRIRRVVLYECNLTADIFGGCGGLTREFLHLVSDYGESASGFTGAGGFDRGVEGEEVGLLRDLVDEFYDLADLASGFISSRAAATVVEDWLISVAETVMDFELMASSSPAAATV